MTASLEIRVDDAEVTAALARVGGPRLRGALVSGLRAASLIAEQDVSAAVALKLGRRTGTLGNSIEGRLRPGELAGEVGIPEGSPAQKYGYLITDQVKEIRPVNARALTIPIGANLTGAGVARFGSVAELKQQFGDEQVIKLERKGKSPVIGVAPKTTRGKFKAYFALVGGVTVRGKDVLAPTVEAARPQMTAAIQREIDSVVSG